MRVDLNVPYHEKDDAKALGAWWDAGRRTWYVRNAENLEPFMRWIDPSLLQLTKRRVGGDGRILSAKLIANSSARSSVVGRRPVLEFV